MDVMCRVGSPGHPDVSASSLREKYAGVFLLPRRFRAKARKKRLLVCVAFKADYERSYETNWLKN
jgi:hypothetical protein